MNSKTGLFIGGWAVTCAAAFFAGRTTEAPDSSNPGERPVASSSRGSGSGSGPTSRRTNSRQSSDSNTEGQSGRIRERAQELKNMSDPIARAQGFLDFVRDLSPDEYLDAIDAFREGGIENEQFGEYRLLLTAWAQVDPVQALEYATENTGTPLARQTILAAWAKNDPQRAIDWARGNFDDKGDESRANPWLVGVIEGLASFDTGRATQLLEELPFSRERGEALSAVFSEISSGGTEVAKSWVAGLTDEKLQAGAAARLAGTLANQDPREAAEWAASMGSEVMSRAAGEIVDRWADNDLTAAQIWVESQSQEVIAAAGPSLIDEMIKQQDVTTASNWLRTFEGNPEFDNTVRSFVYNAMEQEPTVAADWIMKLSNERDQTGTFHRVLRGWMQRDRAGAMDYINNNPVPQSIKDRASNDRQR